MANWCNNNVVFSGKLTAVEKVKGLFKDKQENKDKSEKHWLPPFVIDINFTDERLNYRSRWIPNNEALVQIAKQYRLDLINCYDELNTGIFGEASFSSGVLSNISLDGNDLKANHYDQETNCFIYNGQSYEDERPIFLQLLEQKKSNELYFKTTSSITKEDLNQLYGELLEGDLLLKFAEHKNFVKAHEVFNAMDERTIIEIDNFLINTYRDGPEQFSTRDKFLAMSFLKQLVNDWNGRQNSTNYQADRGL